MKRDYEPPCNCSPCQTLPGHGGWKAMEAGGAGALEGRTFKGSSARVHCFYLHSPAFSVSRLKQPQLGKDLGWISSEWQLFQTKWPFPRQAGEACSPLLTVEEKNENTCPVFSHHGQGDFSPILPPSSPTFMSSSCVTC